MAVGSLSMFVPSLGPINSSSPSNASAVKQFLPAACSAQREEPSRNQPSSGSPGTRNWKAAVSTALAAAVVALGCSWTANADIGSFEIRSGNCIVPNIELKQERLCAENHCANLNAWSGSLEVTTAAYNTEHALFDASILQRSNDAGKHPGVAVDLTSGLVIMDIDPGTAKLSAGILGPSLSAFGFLFIVRIVMSWYPKLPVDEFPYVLAYAPTEPFLMVTRKVIPPLGGVDVTPVVWFGIISFLNEILVGPQGLLVLLSQQVG